MTIALYNCMMQLEIKGAESSMWKLVYIRNII